MGSASVSPRCIPKPSEEDRKLLESRGVVFGEEIKLRMMNVQIPEDWGLIAQTSMGDIWNGYLIDKKGISVGWISWKSSEGGNFTMSTKQKLDLSKVEFSEGWFKPRKSDIDILHVMISDLHSRQKGRFIDESKKIKKNIENFKKEKNLTDVKIVDQTDKGSFETMLNQRNVNIAPKIPWVKTQ